MVPRPQPAPHQARQQGLRRADGVRLVSWPREGQCRPPETSEPLLRPGHLCGAVVGSVTGPGRAGGLVRLLVPNTRGEKPSKVQSEVTRVSHRQDCPRHLELGTLWSSAATLSELGPRACWPAQLSVASLVLTVSRLQCVSPPHFGGSQRRRAGGPRLSSGTLEILASRRLPSTTDVLQLSSTGSPRAGTEAQPRPRPDVSHRVQAVVPFRVVGSIVTGLT